MSITREDELEGMKRVSDVVAETLRAMVDYATPGMSTQQLDQFGARMLLDAGANSAPYKTYNFPGYTCISVGNEFCHGIPSAGRILQEGDLINIDVSAELNGYWSDNGASFVLGRDIHGHQELVNASKDILRLAVDAITDGIRLSQVGHIMESEAKKRGYMVIRNLTGHGIGRSLHEAPAHIANYRDFYNRQRFKKNSVIAVETFISTRSNYAVTLKDGWTMVGNNGGFMAQHEHTLVVTDKAPMILTGKNQLWN